MSLISRISALITAIKTAVNGKVTSFTIAEARAYTGSTIKTIYINEGLKSGTFDYDSTDTTSTDDGAIILVNGTKRYKRRITDFVFPEWWGALGNADETARTGNDDTAAIQSAINYSILYGYTVRLRKKYKITSTLSQLTNSQFSTGVKIIGEDLLKTILVPVGVVGPCIKITGNSSGTPGYHINDVTLAHFSIIGSQTDTPTTHGIELASLQHSTIHDIAIRTLKNDGLRIYSTTDLDTGALEYVTFKNIYIDKCNGWGINCFSIGAYSVTCAFVTFEMCVVNTCGEGMYFEGLQMVKFRDCVSINANNYNLRFGQGTTPCHLIDINAFELGNNFRGDNVPTAKILSMEYVQTMNIQKMRFINNFTEVAFCGIEMGSTTNAAISNVSFNDCWIVQANSSIVGTYKWLYFNPSTDLSRISGITVTRLFLSDFVNGVLSNNLSKVDKLESQYHEEIIPSKEKAEYGLNLVTLNPKLDYRSYFIDYNTSVATLTVSLPSASTLYPTQYPAEGQQLRVTIRNSAGGLGAISWHSYFLVNDNVVPPVGKSKTFLFMFNSITGSWDQIGATLPAVEDASASINTTNTTALTPINGGRYRLAYTANTILTLTAPSNAIEGDKFTLAFWNLNTSNLPVTVTVSLSDIQPSNDNLFVLSTPQYAGFIVEYEYLGGYWFAKTYEVPKNKVLTISSNVNSTSTTRADISNWTFPVGAGREYKIEIIAMYQTNTVTTGGSMGVLLKNSGVGTIIGSMEADVSKSVVATGLKAPIAAISSSNTLADSFLTSTGVSVINSPHGWTATLYFTCTTSGDFQVTWGSEVVASEARLLAGSKMIVTEI